MMWRQLCRPHLASCPPTMHTFLLSCKLNGKALTQLGEEGDCASPSGSWLLPDSESEVEPEEAEGEEAPEPMSAFMFRSSSPAGLCRLLRSSGDALPSASASSSAPSTPASCSAARDSCTAACT